MQVPQKLEHLEKNRRHNQNQTKKFDLELNNFIFCGRINVTKCYLLL